ncbi:hypothetical protein PISL3812_01555 [Talaromyces islandicus]|uniref:Uncharacterized protein n=1 Tax=Talaromyces islandicus TaxID=28573 RepID=A0A0U1LMF1_TALIS|nr:hypothetical protein PISL3812_01555 [Talaromyces islandicus]
MPPASRTPKPLPPPPQKATVKSLAVHQPAKTGRIDVQDAVLSRLRKCLDRANHPNANESEASAALVIANRIMQQHNITQADILAQDEDEANDSETKSPSQYSGSSIVAIYSTRDSNHVVREGFVGNAVSAITTFFDCKSYSTKFDFPKPSIEWTFYGIAENTAAAAIAFEMVYNLIVDWARNHRGRSASYSYCNGVADGLYRTAVKEKDLEKERARQEETTAREREQQEQRLRESSQLNQPKRPDYDCHGVAGEDLYNTADERGQGSHWVDEEHDSDGDIEPENHGIRPQFNQEGIDCIDLTMDLDDAINQILKKEEDRPAETKIKREEFDYMDLTVDDDGQQPHNVKQEPGIKEEMTETVDLTSDAAGRHIKSEPDPTVEKAEETNNVHDHHQELKSENADNHPKVDTGTPMGHLETAWKSEMQLIRFRETAENIAQSFLEQNNIKLRNVKKRKASIKDHGSYKKGKEDSKKINVRQRRIQGA